MEVLVTKRGGFWYFPSLRTKICYYARRLGIMNDKRACQRNVSDLLLYNGPRSNPLTAATPIGGQYKKNSTVHLRFPLFYFEKYSIFCDGYFLLETAEDQLDL